MKKHNEGFSLVEVLLSMVLLAAIVIPTCTSLVLSFRVNAKAEALTQAQLAVSSAVETLMAKGIDAERANEAINSGGIYDIILEESENNTGEVDNNLFPDVGIIILDEEQKTGVYHIKVMDNAGLVTITTYIHVAKEEVADEKTQ